MIEILDFKEINKGAIFGSVNLKITKWGLIINKCLIFQKQGRRWVSLPQEIFEKDGKKTYSPLVKFDENETSERFSRQVLEQIDQFLEAQKPKATNETANQTFQYELPL